MSREWENWFILKEENHIFGVRYIVSKILHPHVCNSVMSAGIMLVYHRFGGIIFSKSLPSRISLPFSSPLKPCFLILWPEMWDFQMSILLPVSRNWGDPLGKALAAGAGGGFKKMGMLPTFSGPQLPFLNSSGQKDRKPTASTPLQVSPL